MYIISNITSQLNIKHVQNYKKQIAGIHTYNNHKNQTYYQTDVLEETYIHNAKCITRK